MFTVLLKVLLLLIALSVIIDTVSKHLFHCDVLSTWFTVLLNSAIVSRVDSIALSKIVDTFKLDTSSQHLICMVMAFMNSSYSRLLLFHIVTGVLSRWG